MIECFKCGECCKTLKEVVITKEELILLGNAEVEPFGDKFKMKLPCKFLIDNKCSVYEIRPCQCRMWHCGRVKKEDKKLEFIGDVQLLIANNLEYQEFKTKMEDEAVEWGNAHGWNWKR